jgi:HPt (histidine-containing phosphotransfer) domain-containing protein
MDGVTATRRIRELSGPARLTPIIALTANALPEQVFEYHRAGMVDHVAKPFLQRELHEAISRAVDPLAKWHRAIDGWTNGRVRPAPPPPDEEEAPMVAAVGDGIFDPKVLAKVEALIPAERVQAYLRELDGHLSTIGNATVADPALHALAHKIISQAGMLGLLRVSARARALADACRSGQGQAEALLCFGEVAHDLRLYAAPAVRMTFEDERGGQAAPVLRAVSTI